MTLPPLEEQECPRCKTTKFRNPSMTLFINSCGHSLCDVCVQAVFSLGTGNCPTCHSSLRKTNFRAQYFDDPAVERETEIRKKVLRDYNLRETDFATPEEYDDYLEKTEKIIYNLVNNIDVEQTKAAIEECRKRNRDKILRNRSTLPPDQEIIEKLLEEEGKIQALRKKARTEESQKMEEVKKKLKTGLIEKLEKNEDLNVIVKDINRDIKEIGDGQENSLKAFGQARVYNSARGRRLNETQTFKYVRTHSFAINGPQVPSTPKMVDCNDKASAGGYRPALEYEKYVQAAFLCLRFADLKEAKRATQKLTGGKSARK